MADTASTLNMALKQLKDSISASRMDTEISRDYHSRIIQKESARALKDIRESSPSVLSPRRGQKVEPDAGGTV